MGNLGTVALQSCCEGRVGGECAEDGTLAGFQNYGAYVKTATPGIFQVAKRLVGQTSVGCFGHGTRTENYMSHGSDEKADVVPSKCWNQTQRKVTSSRSHLHQKGTMLRLFLGWWCFYVLSLASSPRQQSSCIVPVVDPVLGIGPGLPHDG